MKRKEVQKIFKKINKLEKKGYIQQNSGADGIKRKKNSVEIEFIGISKKDKLYKYNKGKLKDFFKKRLKRDVMIIDLKKCIDEKYFSLYVISKKS